MDKIIRIILAILLFFCLADMPYGYYQFVRFAAMIGFGVLAYFSYQEHRHEVAVGWVDIQKKYDYVRFILLALLFQPFFKIALGRDIWNVVDVIVGIGLLLSIFINKQKNKD
jgi:hypothetical protein